MAVSVLAQWFPAQVRRPDRGLRLLQRVYVVVARGEPGEVGDGVTVFDRPDRVLWSSPVDWWASPPIPHTRRAARNGVTLTVPDGGGLVTITPGGGCSCGSLGRWAGPAWAGRVAARVR